MGEAVLLFLGYIVIQIIVMIIGFNVVREKEYGITNLLKSWIFGQMLCFAILQVLAVPMILLRLKFDILFWSFISVVAILFGFGIKRINRIKLSAPLLSPLALLLLMVSVLLILWQAGTYFFGMHLDEDDARWLAEANDALETGDMLTRSFHTGEYLGGFVLELRDITSPWPMLFAVLSRLLFTRVSIVAHTIYPTVEIVAVFGVNYLIASELFNKREAQYSFILLAAVINLFFGGSVYTQGVFTLVRLWQGKASVAAIIVPLLLFLFVCINKRNETKDWLKVAIVGTSGSIMSTMGIIISLVMIGVYGAYNIIAYKHWKRVPLLVISMLPSLIFAAACYCLNKGWLG